MNVNDYFKYKRRVVVKIGSSSLQHAQTGNTDYIKIEKLVRELCDLRNRGMDVCLVSSGAVSVGRQAIGMEERPVNLSTKQACAAVGQARLMMTYQKMFAEYNQTAAQVLITKYTFQQEMSRKNARNTFDELFRMGVIPVVNENDTVATHEIEFGDNDTLSALVTSLVDADLLILLSDIDGLYTDDPRKNPSATLVERVTQMDSVYYSMAKESTGSDVGTGGMTTKMEAARIVTGSGADMIIANGKDVGIIHESIEGEFRGTLFAAQEKGTFDMNDYLRESGENNI